MLISGHVENNVIVLDEKIKLPNGAKVRIMFYDKNIRKSSGLCGIWRDSRSAEKIADELILSRSKGRDFNL